MEGDQEQLSELFLLPLILMAVLQVRDLCYPMHTVGRASRTSMLLPLPLGEVDSSTMNRVRVLRLSLRIQRPLTPTLSQREREQDSHLGTGALLMPAPLAWACHPLHISH